MSVAANESRPRDYSAAWGNRTRRHSSHEVAVAGATRPDRSEARPLGELNFFCRRVSDHGTNVVSALFTFQNRPENGSCRPPPTARKAHVGNASRQQISPCLTLEPRVRSRGGFTHSSGLPPVPPPPGSLPLVFSSVVPPTNLGYCPLKVENWFINIRMREWRPAMRRALDHAEVSQRHAAVRGARKRAKYPVAISSFRHIALLTLQGAVVLAKYLSGRHPAIVCIGRLMVFLWYWRAMLVFNWMLQQVGFYQPTVPQQIAFARRSFDTSKASHHASLPHTPFFSDFPVLFLPSFAVFRRPVHTRSFPGSCSTPRMETCSRRYNGTGDPILFVVSVAVVKACSLNRWVGVYLKHGGERHTPNECAPATNRQQQKKQEGCCCPLSSHTWKFVIFDSQSSLPTRSSLARPPGCFVAETERGRGLSLRRMREATTGPSSTPKVALPPCRFFVSRLLSDPPRNPASPFACFFQFLEEREMGRSSALVPPPSLQRFIGAQGFAAFSGDRPNKRSR